jgi:hypothetical protein
LRDVYPQAHVLHAAVSRAVKEIMVSTRRQKQASCHPLKDTGILQHIFTFLPGSWLLLGAVCGEWKDSYAGIENQRVSSFDEDGRKKLVICGLKTTLYSAAVASPATARLACECGLQICSERKSLQLMAGLHADLEMLAVLRELGMPLSDTVVNAVALSGRLSILQHLVEEQQCPIPDAISCYAARSGSVSMLKWLTAESLSEFGCDTCFGAAEGGHLAALQHLCSEGCQRDDVFLASFAAKSGSIEVVEWLRLHQDLGTSAVSLSWAAGAGQTAMCEHLRTSGCAWDADACNHAAEGGHLGTLRWLRDNDCPWDVSEVCAKAACGGHTDILDYVIEHGEVLGAELLTKALNSAGACNKLQAAQWLRQWCRLACCSSYTGRT